MSAARPDTRNRDEIADAYKWDFSAIYPSWEEWESDMKLLEGYITEYAALKGTLANGADALAKANELGDEIGRLQYKLYRYPQLQRDVDTRNTEVSGKFQRVMALFAKLGTATSWYTPELLEIPAETALGWVESEPRLAPYRFPIAEAYRQASHVLDESGEKIMSFASQFNGTPRSIYQELSTSDVEFPTVTLSDGKEIKVSYGGYSEILNTSRIQADRAAAFQGHYETYAANKNTYAAIYNGILQRDWFTAQARDYPTTLAAALDGDNVPESVYRTLVETVREGTGPVQRYMKVRQQMLELDTYHLYDGSLPLLEDDRTYDYDAMKATVLESVAPLGKDYHAKMANLLDGRWLDVYENDGKRSGAYSAGVYGVGPYMLMNYNDTLDAVFTFAHELGHSMHTVLSYETQPFATASYTIFVAEVASTTNERFLLELLLSRTDDPRERFLLLQHAIDSIFGTFYTQVLFADYEWQAHQLVESGKPVTPDSLSEIYAGLLDAYYGDAVEKDELYRFTWTRIPHFFNSPYYVYKYATCFASSAKLFKDMTTGTKDEQAEARGRYLTLLRSGGNDQPMEQLRKAGVDLDRRETIQAVVEQMTELVGRLETEAAKISAQK
ncbi:oligoendopeptidase F [Synoicihabitans lomoniglobus]|uniref:Oligopeptidase F n=1 Tax=Synoicihabitans lomoniglobus TaxID=2909285 RepID=A0AAE9ZXT2_9BACT|nr:oligoendopeptidase F [Opitutaceae bacterium LMO-M01]WED65274.1 oligoendopeptidase F [Opitutaceae bacterium LMO-M01]